MTTLSRRTKPSSVPKESRRRSGAASEDGRAQPPVRMQEIVRDLGEPPMSFGVDPEAAKRALAAHLKRDKGSDRPFCTCGEGGGYSFDTQLGVYVHARPECWKPSKGYYEAALRAGLLGELPLR